ncbi:CopY family transcriptional repressor [Streptomyces sp. SPB074]|nr:CopY family transcriptional repressor [Streptomyces sp. SPB074]
MGELEDAVMTRVWKWNRPVTVREVLEDLKLERSIAYTTVMTVMDNLHQKGWVRRESEGRAYRYEAVSTRDAYAASLMNEDWGRSDNRAAALVAFFRMMSADQQEALRDAVRMVQGPDPAPEPATGPRAGTETPPPATPAPSGAPAAGTGSGEPVGPEAPAHGPTEPAPPEAPGSASPGTSAPGAAPPAPGPAEEDGER